MGSIYRPKYKDRHGAERESAVWWIQYYSPIARYRRAPKRPITQMKLTGHKTRSVFERYNIVSEGDLRDAASRLDCYAQKAEGQNAGKDGQNMKGMRAVSV